MTSNISIYVEPSKPETIEPQNQQVSGER